VSTKIKAKKDVLRKLGVPEFSINDLLFYLEKTDLIEKKDDKWFANLFRYLGLKKLSDEQLEKLKDLCILKLENGQLTSIKQGNVFFPLKEKREKA